MVRSYIKDVETRILIDRRGEYDTITSGMMEELAANGVRMRRSEALNIPDQLKKERELVFQAIECSLEIRNYEIKIKPMIIQNDAICVSLGRKSAVKLLSRITGLKNRNLAKITRMRKGAKLIKSWMKEDYDGTEEENDDADSEQQSREEKEDRNDGKNDRAQEYSEEQDVQHTRFEHESNIASIVSTDKDRTTSDEDDVESETRRNPPSDGD